MGFWLQKTRSFSTIRSPTSSLRSKARGKVPISLTTNATVAAVNGSSAAIVRKRSARATNVLRFSKAEGKLSQTNPFSIDFTVFGEPIALARHRVSRGIMYNPSVKFQKNFLDVCKHLLPDKPFDGTIQAELFFYFSRPKSHYGTGKNAGKLKDGQAIFHNKRADLDNLVKFVLDALNKHAYLDDSQVAAITCKKMYCEPDCARIEVKMTELDSSASP